MAHGIDRGRKAGLAVRCLDAAEWAKGSISVLPEAQATPEYGETGEQSRQPYADWISHPDQVAPTAQGREWSSESVMCLPQTEDLAKRYAQAVPYPHIVLDDLFAPDLLDVALAEIQDRSPSAEKSYYGSFRKYRTSDLAKMGPITRHLIEYLNSPPFLRCLEQVTGIENLIADPWMVGGGIHEIGPGGFLKVHTDFNWHPRLQLHRRVNFILYLNHDWEEDWRGHFEIWPPDMRECVEQVLPVFNRAVIFSTTDFSYHGHPDPLACPPDRMRRSIALFYYTAERPGDESRFGRSELSNYQARPGESFGGALHAFHQMQLKNSLLRRLVKHLRG